MKQIYISSPAEQPKGRACFERDFIHVSPACRFSGIKKSHSLLDDPLTSAWPFEEGVKDQNRMSILFLQAPFMATDQNSTSSEDNQTQFWRGTLLADNIFPLNRRDRDQITVLTPNL